ERVKMDLQAGDQKKLEFLVLNPNGKVPTLVVDGVPMFEGLAIHIYLAERFGVEKKLWPSDGDPLRLAALSWRAWAYVTFVPALRRKFLASSDRFDKKLHNAAQAELAVKEIDELLHLLEARLARHAYMLGDSFSMVDVIMGSVIDFARLTGVST